ncbi:peptidoglycan DD-metalloendopeptidase family protein [Paraglaciecola aquimarina]|uniref:Peptidoglycan DD-metalloendopeptidase family protein n=1 Tax=Paraglaciecola algarum TaxID=3050085 RepID=A0ABS9DBV9_9ALTE|nr:peptidoglycan DD-metalloendopeptidase family protein [Paraglaciecola sp. G1-23]MCF2950446.1 peptidoglycan DD-metalloendopeptidase family protein [Paraglaciecola sp. G1-23]
MDLTATHKTFYAYYLLLISLVFTSCTNRNTPAPVKELYQGKSYIDFEADAYKANIYIVSKGDTLFSIAWFSGNDYRDLAQINNIKKPYNIYPGQTIQLKSITSSIRQRSQKSTGKTSKIITNQTVDLPKKQAYGESEQNVNSDSKESAIGKFPYQVKRWSWPTNKPVTKGFSAKDDGNKGLDFSGNLGSPILAAADGKVVYTGNALRGFGQLVIIKHTEAYLSAYAHNDQILVKEQQWVKRGQQIANMGDSGTDKVKLHFEVRYKGKSINPLNYLPKR